MAGSTQTQLQTLFEDLVLNSERSTSSSDPTNTLITTLLNQAIKKIARELKPSELMAYSHSTADMTINLNYATFPSTLIMPVTVLVKDTSSKWQLVRAKSLKTMMEERGANNFMDTTAVGTPTAYSLRNGALLFDKHFTRTETAAIAIWGVNKPTALSTSSPSATTELSIDYDLLIIYEAALLYYAREEDIANQQQFEAKAARERAKLQAMLSYNDEQIIRMDPYTFSVGGIDISDPSVLFQ